MAANNLGVDFSHYQSPIDFSAAAGTISFAIGKVSESTSVDPKWYGNRTAAIAAKVILGGYHFAHPNTDPVNAAHVFKSAFNWQPGMLPAFLDVEHNGSPDSPTGAGGRTPAQIHDWIHRFAAAYGAPLGIYTGGWFWNTYVLPAASGCAQCAAMPLWDSKYASSEGAIIRPWTKSAVWQFTDSGHVPGIPGLVDEDRFVSSSLAELITFAGGKAADTTDNEEDELSAAADHIIHTLEASIEKRLADHNAALEQKFTAALTEVYQWLAKAEFGGKLSESHLPYSIKGIRDDILTEIRKDTAK